MQYRMIQRCGAPPPHRLKLGFHIGFATPEQKDKTNSRGDRWFMKNDRTLEGVVNQGDNREDSQDGSHVLEASMVVHCSAESVAYLRRWSLI